jgi:hypothetical protein
MAEGLYSNGTHLELLKNNALLSAENSIQGKLNDQDVFRLSEKEQNAIQILRNILKNSSLNWDICSMSFQTKTCPSLSRVKSLTNTPVSFANRGTIQITGRILSNRL